MGQLRHRVGRVLREGLERIDTRAELGAHRDISEFEQQLIALHITRNGREDDRIARALGPGHLLHELLKCRVAPRSAHSTWTHPYSLPLFAKRFAHPSGACIAVQGGCLNVFEFTTGALFRYRAP